MTLKFYTGVAKGSKLKVRKFWELIPTFIEVTGGKLEGGGGGDFLPLILNSVNICYLEIKKPISITLNLFYCFGIPFFYKQLRSGLKPQNYLFIFEKYFGLIKFLKGCLFSSLTI